MLYRNTWEIYEFTISPSPNLQDWGQSAWEALLACIKVDLVGGGWRDCRISKFGVISLAFREARRCLQNCYVLKYHWEAEQWRRSRLRNWVPELEGIVTWMVEMGQIFPLRLVEIQNDVHKVTKNDILKIYIMKIRLFVYFYFMGLWFMVHDVPNWPVISLTCCDGIRFCGTPMAESTFCLEALQYTHSPNDLLFFRTSIIHPTTLFW